MGAWIEIFLTTIKAVYFPCRTLYGCVDWNMYLYAFWGNCRFVAPFMGAWIEILSPFKGIILQNAVAPFMGAWIEINVAPSFWPARIVAPFMGAWIEINNNAGVEIYKTGRTLYGCVDWNTWWIQLIFTPQNVAPFMGAWIEIFKVQTSGIIATLSHPLWVRGLKFNTPSRGN